MSMSFAWFNSLLDRILTTDLRPTENGAPRRQNGSEGGISVFGCINGEGRIPLPGFNRPKAGLARLNW